MDTMTTVYFWKPILSDNENVSNHLYFFERQSFVFMILS